MSRPKFSCGTVALSTAYARVALHGDTAVDGGAVGVPQWAHLDAILAKLTSIVTAASVTWYLSLDRKGDFRITEPVTVDLDTLGETADADGFGEPLDIDLPYIEARQTDEWKLVIDTASNGETYGVNMTVPSADSVSYTADGSATKAEIADGIAAAWNGDAGCAAVATATSDGVDSVYFRADSQANFTVTKDENAAKMTLTHVGENRSLYLNAVLNAGTATLVGYLSHRDAFEPDGPGEA